MSDTLTTIFGLIGGLAMFLYGMNTMSSALQKAAGEKMKQILGFLTRNAVMGALAGAIVTAVLQSSSATTVMVIGFVSAGLMTLPQGISVIFGANIGTTMTAQLLAFKISNYIYPIIFIGFIINFVAKKEKVKNIGMVIFSFGLLFEGIEIMGSVMKPLASSPIFITLMEKVADMPILGVILGAVMTLVVQSSSATIAVLQNFASQPAADGVSSVIGLAGAIPILLGDNIGTTITALLASIGQNKNAKRTAVAHSVFNISGSVVFLFLIPWFTKFVQWISPKGNEVDVIARQIANAHTTFNIVVTLVWLPLLPLMVKIVTKIIPGEDRIVLYSSEPKYLDKKVLDQPAAALHLVSEEISRCSDYAKSIISDIGTKAVGTQLAEVSKTEEATPESVRQLVDQISEYITRLFTGGVLTELQAEQAAGLLYVNNNIARMTDRLEDISNCLDRIEASQKSLSKEAVKELTKCFKTLIEMFESAIEAVETGNTSYVREVDKKRDELVIAEKKYNKAHMKRIKNQVCDPDLTNDFSEILYNIGRIADNCASVAEEAADNVNFSELAVIADQVEE